MGTNITASILGSASRSGPSNSSARGPAQGGVPAGNAAAGIGFESSDRGSTSENASASIDIINYDVRSVIASAEMAAARAKRPEQVFTQNLQEKILGAHGLRNRYLEQADSGRGTFDIIAPLTSIEQSSVLDTGRLSLDPGNGPSDGDTAFKSRRDR